MIVEPMKNMKLFLKLTHLGKEKNIFGENDGHKIKRQIIKKTKGEKCGN